MSWAKRVLRRLRLSGRIDSFECEIRAELLFHVEMRTQDNIEAGMPPEEARRDALERFGDLEQVAQHCREIKESNRAARLEKVTERLAPILAIAGFGINIVGHFRGITPEVSQIGRLLVIIAILLYLFVYVRSLTFNRRVPPDGKAVK